MIARQEERIAAIEAHRLAQEQGQARQAENNDAEAEERRLRDELREEDRRLAKERAQRRDEHRRKRIDAERKRKNDRADEIAREREALKQQRINARISGMKKRAEVAGMFDKIQTMGGGNIDKIEKTMAKKFGMKPIDKSAVMKASKGRPASAQPRRRRAKKSATVAPSSGGDNVTPTSTTISGAHCRVPSSTTGALVGGSARKAASGSGRSSRQRVRPSSAAPLRRKRRPGSAGKNMRRPGSAVSKRRGGRGGAGGAPGSGHENPELAIEGLRARQNEQLLRVLEQEQEAEERRERILRGITVSVCVFVGLLVRWFVEWGVGLFFPPPPPPAPLSLSAISLRCPAYLPMLTL
jgi:hypothetical protein